MKALGLARADLFSTEESVDLDRGVFVGEIRLALGDKNSPDEIVEVAGFDDPCACGGAGCLEAVASGPKTVAWARREGAFRWA